MSIYFHVVTGEVLPGEYMRVPPAGNCGEDATLECFISFPTEIRWERETDEPGIFSAILAVHQAIYFTTSKKKRNIYIPVLEITILLWLSPISRSMIQECIGVIIKRITSLMTSLNLNVNITRNEFNTCSVC